MATLKHNITNTPIIRQLGSGTAYYSIKINASDDWDMDTDLAIADTIYPRTAVALNFLRNAKDTGFSINTSGNLVGVGAVDITSGRHISLGSGGGYYDGASVKVVGAQGAAVADVSDGLLATTITQLNALLARLRTHGLIAT